MAELLFLSGVTTTIVFAHANTTLAVFSAITFVWVTTTAMCSGFCGWPFLSMPVGLSHASAALSMLSAVVFVGVSVTTNSMLDWYGGSISRFRPRTCFQNMFCLASFYLSQEQPKHGYDGLDIMRSVNGVMPARVLHPVILNRPVYSAHIKYGCAKAIQNGRIVLVNGQRWISKTFSIPLSSKTNPRTAFAIKEACGPSEFFAPRSFCRKDLHYG